MDTTTRDAGDRVGQGRGSLRSTVRTLRRRAIGRQSQSRDPRAGRGGVRPAGGRAHGRPAPPRRAGRCSLPRPGAEHRGTCGTSADHRRRVHEVCRSRDLPGNRGLGVHRGALAVQAPVRGPPSRRRQPPSVTWVARRTTEVTGHSSCRTRRAAARGSRITTLSAVVATIPAMRSSRRARATTSRTDPAASANSCCDTWASRRPRGRWPSEARSSRCTAMRWRTDPKALTAVCSSDVVQAAVQLLGDGPGDPGIPPRRRGECPCADPEDAWTAPPSARSCPPGRPPAPRSPARPRAGHSGR